MDASAFYKLAATFFRGMGESFLGDVEAGGLPAGKFITSDPEVAKHYAHIGAANVLAGNPSSFKRGQARRLLDLGFDPEDVASKTPVTAKPVGGVIRIDVPDEAVPSLKLKPGNVSHLAEFTSPEVIPSRYISVIERGAAPHPGQFAHAATHITTPQVRMAEAAKRKGVPLDRIRGALTAGEALDLAQHQVPHEQLLANARIRRRAATAAMKVLLKHGSAVELVKQAKTLGGFYKGQPSSPDSVKFEANFQGIKIKVDRPKGFVMFGEDSKHKPWRRTYQYDYGFIPKTLGGDHDGLDVFIGPDKKATQTYWAVQRKEDGSFDEYKVFVGFPNREAVSAAYAAHIPRKYFGRLMVLSIEVMKAMLGKEPDEAMKKAAWEGFAAEVMREVAAQRREM